MSRFAPILAATLLLGATAAEARDQIHIVGSSTVYPFSSYVGEELGSTTRNKTPIIESTGTGGGMKLFCAGDGMDTPDIVNASRRMKGSEFDTCNGNGVGKISEVVIGYDGIVAAQNSKAAPMALSRKDVFMALAAQIPDTKGNLIANPNKFWDQVNPKLPHRPILVYGPPSSSGTRDAFEELGMAEIGKGIAAYTNLYAADPKKNAAYKEYRQIRQDGVYVPSGENDNLIVQKLVKDANAIGIFGYSFLEENADRLTGATIDGIAPTPANIASDKYPYARSLYFYVKQSHLAPMPAIADYIKLFLSEPMIGDKGALPRIGLISQPKAKRDAVRADVAKGALLSRKAMGK